MKGERHKIGLAGNKSEGNTPIFEGQCDSRVYGSAVSVEVGNGDPYSSKDARIIDDYTNQGGT